MVQEASRLPFREGELFAADCAERVLYLYEMAYPSDTHVREAIDARRRHAKGQLSEKEWEIKQRHAASSAIADAARAAIDAANAVCEKAWQNTFSLADKFLAVKTASTTVYAEHMWQWQQVQRYLRGEII